MRTKSLARGFAVVFVAGAIGTAWGQSKTPEVHLAAPDVHLAAPEAHLAGPAAKDTRPLQTFRLATGTDANGNAGNEILTALRLMLDPAVKFYLTPSQDAITMRGTSEELAQAQRLIGELDRPRKLYRLTFTLTQMDGGTKVGVQHFGLVAAAGMRSTLKRGSKIPVVTETNSEASGAQTQFQYLDVGISLDVTPEEYAGGIRLKAKVEDSSVAPEATPIANVQEPVVRQTTLEGSSFAVLGKPLVLGSLDTPGSTRHTEVEVLVEVVK